MSEIGTIRLSKNSLNLLKRIKYKMALKQDKLDMTMEEVLLELIKNYEEK